MDDGRARARHRTSLPLLSYGGSSLVASFLQVGLIQNVAMRWREYLTRLDPARKAIASSRP